MVIFLVVFSHQIANPDYQKFLYKSFDLFAIFTRVSITGTSVNTPTVVANAAGLEVPNKATATATDNSKKFDAPIIPAGAAMSYGSLINLHIPNARKNIKNV